jgi:hypothetical protein
MSRPVCFLTYKPMTVLNPLPFRGDYLHMDFAALAMR